MACVIIFDLFHTLVSPEDHWPAGYNRERAAAEALGIDPAALAGFWDGPGRDRYTGTPVAQLLEAAVLDQGMEVKDGAMVMALEGYGRYHDRALRSPRPAVIRGLRALSEAGSALALLSNADDREVAAWRRSVLAGLIPAAWFSFEMGAAKPDPAVYRRVLAGVSGDPSSAIFVGDGGSDEFGGARAAGVGRIVCVTGFGTPDGLRRHEAISQASLLADETVDSVAELPGLLGV